MNSILTLGLGALGLFYLGIVLYTYGNPNLSKTKFLKTIFVVFCLQIGYALISLMEFIFAAAENINVKDLI